MNRKLTTALASAALFVFCAAPAHTHAQSGPQRDAHGNERTGQKVAKEVQAACPVHPEVKARTPEKCPKCRIEARKMKAARDKDKDKVNRRPAQAGENGNSGN
jgi:hypothetical protein